MNLKKLENNLENIANTINSTPARRIATQVGATAAAFFAAAAHDYVISAEDVNNWTNHVVAYGFAFPIGRYMLPFLDRVGQTIEKSMENAALGRDPSRKYSNSDILD